MYGYTVIKVFGLYFFFLIIVKHSLQNLNKKCSEDKSFCELFFSSIIAGSQMKRSEKKTADLAKGLQASSMRKYYFRGIIIPVILIELLAPH